MRGSILHTMKKITAIAAVVAFFVPALASASNYYPAGGCSSYYNFNSCNSYTHIFSPYTSVNAHYPISYQMQYPTQYQQPYQMNYHPTYSYPTYSQDYSYPSYSYNSNSYSYSYGSEDQYCYSGYGCYPFPVDDPHQWVYDSWTGTWY